MLEQQTGEPRAAAVLLAIFADPPHHVVFVERAAHLRNHPGQIALPGGTQDPADGDNPVTTALRELHEELGITPDRVTIVGRLPTLTQSSRRFTVTPIVGILQPQTLLVIDHTETAAVFTVPLEKVLAREHGDLHIWGLTERILKAFVDDWNAEGSRLRAEIERRLDSGI
jgi:8-oxo-dGTP pyrophosphatase MutT (NUDIX family)